MSDDIVNERDQQHNQNEEEEQLAEEQFEEEFDEDDIPVIDLHNELLVHEDSNGQSDEEQPDVDYDFSLPVAHSYLGEDLTEIRGRTILEDESIITLPLYDHPGVILVPGQTFPLYLHEQRIIAMMQSLIDENKKTFCIVASHIHHHDKACRWGIGTTAEILSFHRSVDDATGIMEARMIAIGRQRIRVLSSERTLDGTLQGLVHVLPEVELGASLPNSRSPQLLSSPKCSRKSYFQRNRMIARNYSQPMWIHAMYEKNLLMSRMRDELRSWNPKLDKDSPPNVTDFSFWVAAVLPLDDLTKLSILQVNNVVQRLRLELSMIESLAIFCCRQCNAIITRKNEVFSMSSEGPTAAYVNRGGHVHETVTVFKVRGVVLRGSPMTVDSWFPGFAWTIIECSTCRSHLGWKFTATRSSLSPVKFFGLCRQSLTPNIVSQTKKV